MIEKSPNDLIPCVYLCVGKLAPAYVGLELGIADHSLMKVSQYNDEQIRNLVEIGPKNRLNV